MADLRILPFFYQTPLFLSLVLVGGAGLISGIFKWRVLRIRRLNQELEANVRIRTREVTEQKELLAQTNLELQALQNTSTAISGTLDKVDLGRLILEASMSLLNCPGGFLIDYVWATQSVHVTQALGLASKLKGLTLPVRETISWDVIETRESRILPWDEIRARVTQPALRKMLIPCQIVMVPMISSNRVVGILALGREDSSTPFNERDLSLLTTFANQAAVATRNAELYQDMRASESKYRTLVEQAGDAGAEQALEIDRRPQRLRGFLELGDARIDCGFEAHDLFEVFRQIMFVERTFSIRQLPPLFEQGHHLALKQIHSGTQLSSQLFGFRWVQFLGKFSCQSGHDINHFCGASLHRLLETMLLTRHLAKICTDCAPRSLFCCHYLLSEGIAKYCRTP
jgi:hypothetical protein